MPLSSPKSLFLSLLALIVPGIACGALARTSSYKVTLESRLAAHAVEPRDLASHRHTLEAEQRMEFHSPWSLVAGFRAYAEAAFAVNPRYDGAPVQRDTSQQLLLRDLYLEYKKKRFLFRLGNQQVVWGEAFGFYYADIVNPKDLRELGLNDLTQQRLMTPMANAVLFFPRGSAQLVFIPKPYFHHMGALGSDFEPPLREFFPGAELTVSDDRTRPFSILDGEFGFRLTRLWMGWDLGLFFMTYYDRYPNYVPRVTSHSPLEVQVTTEHPRLGSLGLTGTKDFRSLLFRFESMYTRQRTYDAFQPPNYFQFQSDEVVAALELETTRYTPWRLGAQLAHTWIPHRVAGALAMPHRTLVSANLRGPLWDETTLETILSYGIQDGSSLARLRYTIPTSTQIELVLGADLLFGGRQSQFGRYHPASRAYVMLRGYLVK